MIRKLKAMPYAQAHIEIHGDTAYLFSYYTLVATVREQDGEKWIRCYGLYSATTRKHISAFAKEYSLTYQDFKDKRASLMSLTPQRVKSFLITNKFILLLLYKRLPL